MFSLLRMMTSCLTQMTSDDNVVAVVVVDDNNNFFHLKEFCPNIFVRSNQIKIEIDLIRFDFQFLHNKHAHTPNKHTVKNLIVFFCIKIIFHSFQIQTEQTNQRIKQQREKICQSRIFIIQKTRTKKKSLNWTFVHHHHHHYNHIIIHSFTMKKKILTNELTQNSHTHTQTDKHARLSKKKKKILKLN